MRFPTGPDSGGEEESRVGHLPALTSSPLGGQESSSELMETAPEETASTAGDVPPTGSCPCDRG